jgi:predicted negative regulator of RcsB-dependent stress response
MSAQSVADRSRRPSSPESDDALMVRALEFSTWAKANVRALIAAAVVIVAIVAGLIYWRAYREARMERAATEFLRLEQTAQSGNLALAGRDLETYIRRYDGTVYSDQARIALAQLHLQQDSAAKAVAVLEGAESRVDDSPVGAQAALLLAAAQQAAGDPEAAIAVYTTVAEEADLTFRRVAALEAMAQLQSRNGDFAGAAATYTRLAEMSEEGTPERQIYEMRLAEARAKVGAAAAD